MPTIQDLEQKIRQLEQLIIKQQTDTKALLTKSDRALDEALHTYRIDHAGYVWVWDPEQKHYRKTDVCVRVIIPKVKPKEITNVKIADKAVNNRTLDDNCVDNRVLSDNAVRENNIKAGSVTGSKIPEKTISPEHVTDDFISRMIMRPIEKWENATIRPLYKEMAELRQLVTSYVASGIALSNNFGSHEDIGITQKTITDAINSLWNAIRDLKGENNDGITLTITPDWFISEDTAEVNILAQANDGVFETLQIYINDVPVWEEPLKNVQRYEYTAEMSETSLVRVEAQILGITYTKEEYVTKYYPFFMGSGTDWEDIVNEKYVRDLNDGKLRGGYNINVEHDGDYMFIIIPSSREHEIVRFDMNGYEIPIIVLNNQKYTIYQSANTYRRGLFNIDITTNCECEDCDNEQ